MDDLMGITLLAEIVAIIIIWTSLRYAVLKEPLSLWDKFGAFIIGFYAGRGVVLLYQHPTFEFWKEIPFFSIKFALAVLWLAVLSILLLHFLLSKVG